MQFFRLLLIICTTVMVATPAGAVQVLKRIENADKASFWEIALKTAAKVGGAPIVVADTDLLGMVKVKTDKGDLLVSYSREDHLVVVTMAPPSVEETYLVQMKDGRYLKLAVEYDVSPEDRPQMYSAASKRKDSALMYLRGLTAELVLTNDGKDSIKDRLVALANNTSGDIVKGAYFTQFIVQ